MFPIMAGNSASTGYNLTRSLRFRASASAHLSRTPSVTGNNYTWTYSAWVKRGALGIDGALLWAGVQSSGFKNLVIKFDTSNTLTVYGYVDGGSIDINIQTTQVFRDPSAFYHIVVVVDTTQATSSNRVKIYVNGLQVTSLTATTYPALNYITPVNEGRAHNIGRWLTTGSVYFDGEMTEVNFIDGQALTPSSFGSTNALTGVWQPARYTGSYGTNGFYLPFTDNSALTTSSNVGLGKDFSGNGNYWTTNNISITAGVTYDSMTDVPTLTSATASNFCVLNPLNTESGMTGTLTDGNLTLSGSGGKRSTIAARSGKWYWEFVSNSGAASNFPMSGVYVVGAGTFYPGLDGNSVGYFQGGDIYYNGSIVFTASSYTNGDLIGFAWDADTGKVYVAKNGTWQNSGNPAAGTGQVATISTGVDRVVGAYSSSGSSAINFGQRPFSYTPPTGFVALNTFNLPTSTIVKGNTVMDATLYTGNGGIQSVTNAAAFKPDLVWNKVRSTANSHVLEDSVRGATKGLYSDSTSAEVTNADFLQSFNSGGFTVGPNALVNQSSATYVAWQWQAGQGSSSSNTNGTITSTVSVNASAGFSVITFNGTGAAATVGHGLGVAPAFYIAKYRSGSAPNIAGWACYHSALTSAAYRIDLNSTSGQISDTNAFNGTAPTSSVLSIGTNLSVSSTPMVVYAWTPIAGYSAFGSISANGAADNAFVYTGFLPRFVLFKRTDSTSNWIIWDTARNTFNVLGNELYPNLANAEASAVDLDILSNGFKLRSASFSGTWIYAAFATTPFKNSLGF